MFAFLRFSQRQLIGNHSGYLMTTQFYGTKLSLKEACAVKKSWKGLVKDKKVKGVAVDFFSKLFKQYPDYAGLFKRFGECPEEILGNKCFMKDHAMGKVFKTLGKFIAKLDEPDKVKQEAIIVGKRHVKYCMKPEHFKNSTKILFQAVEKNACEMDCTTKKGWEQALKLIMGGLAMGLKC